MKKIIILLTGQVPNQPTLKVEAIFWLTVQAGREVEIAGYDSRYADATQEETDALRDGSVIEQSGSWNYPDNWTNAQIKADLVTRHGTAQAHLDAQPNPNQFYGAYWDGSTWNNP